MQMEGRAPRTGTVFGLHLRTQTPENELNKLNELYENFLKSHLKKILTCCKGNLLTTHLFLNKKKKAITTLPYSNALTLLRQAPSAGCFKAPAHVCPCNVRQHTC